MLEPEGLKLFFKHLVSVCQLKNSKFFGLGEKNASLVFSLSLTFTIRHP